MKVVILYPSWTGGYGIFAHFAKRQGTWPPLNLALLAAIAEQHGHEVVLIDAEAETIPLPELVRQTIAHKPDMIALSGMSPFFHLTKDLSMALKEANKKIPIAVGGAHMTIMKEKVFSPSFDFGFIGEAEESWPKFLKFYGEGKDVSDIKGILYRRNGKVIYTGPSIFDRNLDLLPFPARHLLNMERYKMGTMQGRKNFTSIQTTRGCPWKCIFCASEALKTTSVVKRSPASVIKEIKEVVSKFNIRHFFFVDDVLTLERKRIMEICNLIIKERLSITFEGGTRANLLDEELILLMKEAGLVRLGFGLETVNTEMRDTMKKKVPLKYYTEANKLLNKHNIEATNSVMLGLPGETRETIKTTLEWLRNAREVKQANFAIAVPYPGTEFHEMAVSGKQGIKLMTNNFSEYRRYGSAVTTINDLTPRDLVELQNDGFVSIYSAPWRWIPMLKKHGIVGGLLMLLRLFRLIIRKFYKQ